MKKYDEDFPRRVKDRVDYIYELLKECPTGYTGGFATSDNLTRRVKQALVSRKVVLQQRDQSLPRMCYSYTWNSDMAPTTTLYRSIVEDVRKMISYDNNKRPVQHPKYPMVANTSKVESRMDDNILSKFTAQELWDELKRRGARVVDGELVIIQKLK